MTAAWVTIAVLVLGVPLAAVWLGGRRFWSRLRPGREPDPYGDLVRHHGLTPAEAVRLSREVPQGTRYDDDRLRRAAIDMAEMQLGQGLFPEGASRTQRVLVVLLFLWITAVVGRVVFLVVAGRPEDVNWFSGLLWASLLVWHLHRRRGLRRTIARNEPTAPDRD